MAGERAELERLRKVKRLRELEAKATSAPSVPEPQAQPTPDVPASFMERLQSAARQEPTLFLGPQVAMGEAAEQGVRRAFEMGGEAIAEQLPQGITAKPLAGIPGAPLVPTPAQFGQDAIRTSPEVAAGLGTAFSMVPDVASAALGGGLGVAGKRALTRAFSPKQIGAEIGALEKAAGITQKLPETKNLIKALDLPKGTSFSGAVNALEQALDTGFSVGKQTLADAKVLVKKALNTPAFSQGQPRAFLARAASKIDDAFNQAIKGRAEKAKEFKGAKQRQELLSKVLRGTGSVAAKGAALGAAGAGIGGAIKLFGG